MPLSELCERRGGQGLADLAQDGCQSLGFSGGRGGCSGTIISMECSLIWCTPEESGCLLGRTDFRMSCMGANDEKSSEITQNTR